MHLGAITFPDRSGASAPTGMLYLPTEDTAQVLSISKLSKAPNFTVFLSDVDECSTPANNCKFMCKNLIGSFMCICPEGYSQIGLSDDCRDIDECSENPNLCDNGRCINLQGSYRCECHEGFEHSADRKRCIGMLQIFRNF